MLAAFFKILAPLILVLPGIVAAYLVLGAEDPNEAVRAMEAFVEDYPEYPGALVNLSIAYDRAERTDDAMQMVDMALAIDPEYKYALNQQGILLRKQGDLQAADKAWRAALAQDENYANAWYNLGVLYDLYFQDLETALDAYQRYQALAADDPGFTEPDRQVAGWIRDLERRLGQALQASQGVE